MSSNRQSGPVADIDKATDEWIRRRCCKTIYLRASERSGSRHLTHFCMPTTLGGAECTPAGGCTGADGSKIGFRDPSMNMAATSHDPYFTANNPRSLWLSTRIRALDHAVKCMHGPLATKTPREASALYAAGELYRALRNASKKSDGHDTGIDTQLMSAVYASSGLQGEVELRVTGPNLT